MRDCRGAVTRDYVLYAARLAVVTAWRAYRDWAEIAGITGTLGDEATRAKGEFEAACAALREALREAP